MPEGALFCPDCGARAPEYSVAQSDLSPSHFNSGVTATSQPQTTLASPDGSALAVSPPSPPEEKRRGSLAGRRGVALVVIVALAVLLVGVSLEAGVLGTSGGPSVNSASTPLTGQQLYAAYGANRTQADASYTNKTIFIRDSLDFGVGVDRAGQYFSSVNSGLVILVWGDQAQVGRLSQGDTVLAKCSVAGTQPGLGGGYVLYLRNCDLISVRSQTGSHSVPEANL
jgi:hypothetical protein